MTGEWVQAENGRDERLDVFVWVETPEPTTGTVTTIGEKASPILLGPNGMPVRQNALNRRIGFGKP